MPQNIKTKHYTKHLVFPKVRINWSSFSQYNIYKDIKSLRNIYIIKGLLKYWLFKSFKEEKGILLGWIRILIIFLWPFLDLSYLDGWIRIILTVWSGSGFHGDKIRLRVNNPRICNPPSNILMCNMVVWTSRICN